jgi:hypothetical protein
MVKLAAAVGPYGDDGDARLAPLVAEHVDQACCFMLRAMIRQSSKGFSTTTLSLMSKNRPGRPES